MQSLEGALADKESYSDKRPIPTLCNFYKNKGPLQTKGPYIIYMQGCKGLLQTRAPSYKQGPLHYIQTRAPCRETLKTRAHPDGGPYRQSDSTAKGSLHTKGSYRQGGTTDKGFIQTKGIYSKGPL